MLIELTLPPSPNNLGMGPDWNPGLVISKLMDPAQGHWSMTVRRKRLPTHCLLWRTTPAGPPCLLNHFPNIGEALQRTRSLPINSVCFPERNTSKTAFHRIIIGSSWILTKAPNPFMLEKPRLKCFFERSHLLFFPLSPKFLLLILSSPHSLSGSGHYCVWHRRWADSWSVEVSQGGKCKLIFAHQLLSLSSCDVCTFFVLLFILAYFGRNSWILIPVFQKHVITIWFLHLTDVILHPVAKLNLVHLQGTRLVPGSVIKATSKKEVDNRCSTILNIF